MRFFLISFSLFLFNYCFSQSSNKLDLNSIQTTWDITYTSFANILGTNPMNFQLIIPFKEINCSENSGGTINSEIYNLINGMPNWNTNGKYQSGASFWNAYKTFLDILVHKPDSTLIIQAQQEYEVSKRNIDLYNTTLIKAIKVYNKSDKTQTFDSWLHTPYSLGSSYGKRLLLEEEKYRTQQELYKSYLSQLNDTLLGNSKKLFNDSSYYSKVYSFTSKDTLLLPGYAPVACPYHYLKKSDSFKVKSYRLVQNSSIELHLINKETKEELPIIQDSLTVSIVFDKWGIIPVLPLPWFNESILIAKGNNKNAMRSGYAPKKTDQEGAWIFGKGGIIPSRITDLLIGYNLKMEIGGFINYSAQLQNELKNNTYEVKIGKTFVDEDIVYVKKKGREYNITIQYIAEKPFIWGAYIKKY